MEDLDRAKVTYATGKVVDITDIDEYRNRDGFGHFFYRKHDVIFIAGREVVRIDFERSKPRVNEPPIARTSSRPRSLFA